ncbi:unnamed protein product [Adineta ricciae]|uniref:Uncharacterized protein n=1 Tax=Adineta ricciae TaxID=249248 RepID=A0A816DW50_ADIRI|nr:unnamed protein product [Adineta ricciae]
MGSEYGIVRPENVARPAAFWFILLAVIDRWLLPNQNVYYRRMSTVKNGKRSMIVVFILSVIVFLHVIYSYESNLVYAPVRCYGVTLTCRFVTDVLFILGSIFIRLELMLVFGLLTIRNIR